MHYLFLLVALSAACVSALPIDGGATFYDIPEGSCGLNKYNNTEPSVVPYIVGGHATQVSGYPWQVALQFQNMLACGGTIISDRYILTAAHCFDDVKRPSSWRVLAGKHTLAKNEPGQHTFKVAQIIIHKDYKITTAENDIALMKLTTDIWYKDTMQPVCLPPADIGDLVGVEGTITGWGDLSEGGESPTLLQETTVPILANDKCQEKFSEEVILPTQFCAGLEEGGRDTCQGDSGGPMVVLRDGKYTIVGITSSGYGCAQPNQPGFYTRVSSYVDWIAANMT